MPLLIRLFILAAALAWPSAGQTTSAVGTLNGTIQNVNSEGDIILVDGTRVHLWGLKITGIDSANQLLANKSMACAILARYDDTLTADCILLPSKASRGAKRNNIDLFTWLVEFGIADYHCSDFERKLGSVMHARGYLYACEPSQTPTREQVIKTVIE